MNVRSAAIFSLLASLLLSAFSGLCWMASNVYFRPVHYATREGEGDPYLVALQCGSQLATEMLIPTLALAFMNVFMAGAILRTSTSPLESTDTESN